MTKKYFDLIANLMKMKANCSYYSNVTKGCRLTAVTEGKVSVEFEVEESMTNAMGTLHGGCSATLVDVLTTMALIATPKSLPGVSVDLHMTYLAAAKKGETVVLDAEVLRMGNTLGFTRADLIRKKDRTLIATGLHTKAFGSKPFPHPHHNK